MEAQSFSVMFVWALARPESAATVAADARRNLDSIVDPVLVGKDLSKWIYLKNAALL